MNVPLAIFGAVLFVAAAFSLWFVIGIAMDMNRRLPWEKVDTRYLRGFKYGDVVTLDSGSLTYSMMVLSVRISYPKSRLPVEHVTTIHLHPAAHGEILPIETMASIWKKVDDA